MKKEDIFNKIGKISEKYGKGLYVVLGLLGVLLIIGGNGKTDGQTKVVQAETDAEEYRCNIENNLSEAISMANELYNDKNALYDKRKICMYQDFSWATR